MADEDSGVDQEDIKLDVKKEETIDHLNQKPHDLINERTWDKMIKDKVNEIIDRNIIVLN